MSPIWVAFHLIAILVLVAERMFIIACCFSLACAVGTILVLWRWRSGGTLLGFFLGVLAGIGALTIAVGWLLSGDIN